MKKQMIALAVAGAFVGSAFAANVSVYGVVDTGLVYSNTEYSGEVADVVGAKDKHSFSMNSGSLAGSRFGLTGKEDLGDGYSVEFKLENGFASDTGKFSFDDKIFGREARLSLNTPYGQLSFGRMGAITSGAGSYDIFQANGDALDGGNETYIGTGYWFSRGRYDNMITYVSPEANGFTGYAQYSFQTSGSENSSVRDNDRYMGLGLTYSAGPLNVVLAADMVQYSKASVDKFNYSPSDDYKGYFEDEDGGYWVDDRTDYHDAKAISFGVNYDFGVTKAFFGAQYGKNEALDISTFGIKSGTEVDGKTQGVDTLIVDGYNLHIGAVTPLPCGELSVSVYYGDYEQSDDSSVTAKKYGIGVVHTYPLSKRTKIYAGAGYGQTDIEFKDDGEKAYARVKGYDVMLGLNHSF